MGRARHLVSIALLLSLAPGWAAAEMSLPPGFQASVYISGEGFDSSQERGARGIPSVSTLAFDSGGVLYLARTSRRYIATGGEVEDTWPIYRVPAGGARFSPATQGRYLHGPPLPNPQIAAVRGERELLVTTFDRERKIGVLYRMVDGRAEMLAGGTPAAGAAPLLRQPEGIAFDPGGALYIADRLEGAIVKLDASGRPVARRHVELTRPRVLAADRDGALWVGADGSVEAPWQQGEGQIWRVTPEGAARLVLRGPITQAIALSPRGNLIAADRQGGHVFAVTPEGTRIDLLRFTDGDAPRSLAFAPVTAATERAGIAGQLFVVVIKNAAWPVNEVLRISGPIDDFVRDRAGRAP